MSTKRKTNSAAENTEVRSAKTTDEMLLAFIELLSDEQVVGKLRKALFPHVLADKIDGLTTKISTLTDRLAQRDDYIRELEKRVTTVETNYDRLEQYSRCSNLRFHGIDESDNDDTTAKVIAIANGIMKVEPPIGIGDIVTSHRLGKPSAGGKPRPVIVRFTDNRPRDVILQAKRQLLDSRSQIFVNENLTQHRAKLASKTRQLKKDHKIGDCWTFNGRVMLKTTDNAVREVLTEADCNIYRPPKDLNEHYLSFINEFSQLLSHLQTNNAEVILAGDFNINLLQINEKRLFSQFFDGLTENCFYPKITLPTRFSNKHGTLIDNFMCKLTKCTLNTTAGIFTKRLSDHQPYFIFLNTANPKIATPKYIHVNSLNPVAISNFVNGIKLSNIYITS